MSLPSTDELPRITADEFLAILREGMPSALAMGFDVVALARGAAHVRTRAHERDLRPGGSVAGPTLFWLADLTVYAAVMTAVGPLPLAVTTDATIHFLKKPRAGVLDARAKLLKVGRRLVVADVHIDADGAAVAHAVMTYALPDT
ncbi:MAG TPA: PaaI family thioesterase [Byssovorax sp.]|jgi:uncharacterized protein (TIGR00369 family)